MKMINRKYKSIFALCLAGIWLAIVAPKIVRDHYPTEFCLNKKVKYYCFSRHYWLGKESK